MSKHMRNDREWDERPRGCRTHRQKEIQGAWMRDAAAPPLTHHPAITTPVAVRDMAQAPGRGQQIPGV